MSIPIIETINKTTSDLLQVEKAITIAVASRDQAIGILKGLIKKKDRLLKALEDAWIIYQEEKAYREARKPESGIMRYPGED